MRDQLARLVGISLLLVGLFLSLFGSGQDLAEAQVKIIITDDRGKEIVIEKTPERVVVAGTPLYTEILVDVGALDRVVGVTESPDNPPEVENVPKVGPSFPGPNIELILELDPDIVFGAVGDVRDRLESAGLTVVTPISFITRMPDIFRLARVLGLIMDETVNAELLIGRIGEAIVDIESRVVQRKRPRAAFLFAPPESPPFAAGRGSVEGEILARAGAENVFSDLEGVQQVSVEAVIERDPQAIFTDPSQIRNITGNPLWASISAVENGNVFGIKASSLTSTRVAEALRTMARALHPNAFRRGGE